MPEHGPPVEQSLDILDRPLLPWKNGRGRTRELLAAADPEGRILWRLSLADIERNGPFSIFPGMRRHHVVVQGAGLTLYGDSREIAARPFVAVEFSGGTALDAILTKGPCRAANLLFDPRSVAVMTCVPVAGAWTADADEILICCLAGAAALEMPRGELRAGQVARLYDRVRMSVAKNARLAAFAIRYLPGAR